MSIRHPEVSIHLEWKDGRVMDSEPVFEEVVCAKGGAVERFMHDPTVSKVTLTPIEPEKEEPQWLHAPAFGAMPTQVVLRSW